MDRALTLQAGGVAGRSPRFLLAAGVIGAWILAGLCMLLMMKSPLADRLGDTDDALRLVFVRDFLASGDFFDLHLERLQPPTGYEFALVAPHRCGNGRDLSRGEAVPWP